MDWTFYQNFSNVSTQDGGFGGGPTSLLGFPSQNIYGVPHIPHLGLTDLIKQGFIRPSHAGFVVHALRYVDITYPGFLGRRQTGTTKQTYGGLTGHFQP